MAEAFLLQQGDTREQLMEEARHIKNIVPGRNIDEIYSSLETFFDDPKRVQKVVLHFLDHVKEEKLPRRPRKRSRDEHNEPSTSGIPPKKSSKIPVYRSDKDNRSETQTDSDTSLESAHSDSHPAEIDRDIETDRIDLFLDQFNFTNSSGSTSDVGSEDKINEIKEYLQEAKGFPFLLDEEGDTMDTFTEPVKKVDGRMKDDKRNEPSTSAAPILAENGNQENMPERNIPVDLTLPGPSTANYNLHLPPAGLDDSDVVLIDVNGVDHEKKKAYYNSLIEIFPDADKHFLRAICDKCTQDDNWLSDTSPISGLLENGYPKAADTDEQEQGKVANQKVSVKTEEVKKKLIEENYNNLLAIFPNADPTYIRETCEQIADDEDAMKKVVGDTLESGKYPTLAEYEEQMKVIEIRDKYLKNFKIEEFLDIFPDPVKYFFEENKNNNNDSELSLNYLKSHYRKIRVATLQQCLTKNNCSLAKSCAELDKCKNFMKSKRGEHEIQYCEKDMKNIPFMQEEFVSSLEKCIAQAENAKRIHEELLKEKRNHMLETDDLKLIQQHTERANLMVSTFVESEEKRCSDLHTTVKMHGEETSENVKEFLERVSFLKSGTEIETIVNREVQEIESAWSKHPRFFQQQLGNISENLKEVRKQHEAHTQFLTDQLHNSAHALEVHVEEKQKAYKSFIHDCVNHLEEQYAWTADWQYNIDNCVQQCDQDVSQFLEESLHKDVPTGNTPRRRQYNYPTTIVNSTPTRIMGTLHKIKDAVKLKSKLDKVTSEAKSTGQITNTTGMENTLRTPVNMHRVKSNKDVNKENLTPTVNLQIEKSRQDKSLHDMNVTLRKPFKTKNC